MMNLKPQIKYRAGYKYQLASSYSVSVKIFPEQDIETQLLSLSKKGRLKIKTAYSWDGPSGPTINTKSFMRGSLVHDAIFQLLRLELIPKAWRLEADQELRRICLEDGMYSWRAWYIYYAVRWFAGTAASPENKKEVLTAP